MASPWCRVCNWLFVVCHNTDCHNELFYNGCLKCVYSKCELQCWPLSGYDFMMGEKEGNKWITLKDWSHFMLVTTEVILKGQTSLIEIYFQYIVDWICNHAIVMLVNIGSGNGLVPEWHQAISRTNVDWLVVRLGGTHLNVNTFSVEIHFDGLAQDCSISIANALEILQSFTKTSI